jgi:predicted permease
MAIEVALASVLVTGAALLAYSLVELHVTPAGFDPHGLVYIGVDLAKHPLDDPRMQSTYREIVDQLRKLPEVSSVSIADTVLINLSSMQENMQTPGGSIHHFWRSAVGPDYFQTMRTRMLSGRDLRWTDGPPSRKVVVNRSAAMLFSPGGQVLGRHVIFEDRHKEAEVVGVVEDSKYSNLRDAAPPTVYSLASTEDALKGQSFAFVVRVNGSPAPLVAAARVIARKLLPDIPAPAAFGMEQLIADSLVTERMMTTLALLFGALALLMTAIGLYGTLAYTTERRTGEIGIRLALGAMPANVIKLVCAENGAIVLSGCLLGTICSIATSKTITSFLYGVSPKDPIAFGFAALVLIAVASTASLLPAIKASKIDPVAAIRHE